MRQNIEDLINCFISNTLKATHLLYSNSLYGHLMVVIYSSIDSMGLLDAPANQTSASGQSFKDWVNKYMLTYPGLEFNEVDFWAARCSVLHTFTAQSDLSSAGKARQIQYCSGPKDSPMALAFFTATRQIDSGAHVPAHIEDTYLAFLDGLEKFASDLLENCKRSQSHESRLRNVLQQFAL